MKKFKRVICAALLMGTLALTGCTHVDQAGRENQTSMFVLVERTSAWQVVYHRDSGVMYVISERGQGSGEFTMLVNSDGTPMIYGEGY